MKVYRSSLTDHEKAIIIYAINENISNRQEIYKLIIGEANFNRLQDNSLKTLVYKYFHQTKVLQFIEDYKGILEARKKAIIQNYFNTHQIENTRIAGDIEGEEINNKRKRTGEGEIVPEFEINFADKNQFINYLNSQINILQDPKQKTDYLKMLSDLLRFKEAENKNTEEIQRFYSPVTCSNCAIYQRFKDIDI